MAMLLKLQEAANYIESPDKEDPGLPKLWTPTLNMYIFFFLQKVCTVRKSTSRSHLIFSSLALTYKIQIIVMDPEWAVYKRCMLFYWIIFNTSLALDALRLVLTSSYKTQFSWLQGISAKNFALRDIKSPSSGAILNLFWKRVWQHNSPMFLAQFFGTYLPFKYLKAKSFTYAILNFTTRAGETSMP